jgi:hypothetical protein
MSNVLDNCATNPVDVRVVAGEITAGFPVPLEVTATNPLPVTIENQPIVVTGSVSVTASVPLEITGEVTVDAYEQAVQVVPTCFLRNGLHTIGHQVITYDLTVQPAVETGRTLYYQDGTLVTGSPVLEQCPDQQYTITTLPTCYDNNGVVSIGFKAVVFNRAIDDVTTTLYTANGTPTAGTEVACEQLEIKRDRVCLEIGGDIAHGFLSTVYSFENGSPTPTILTRMVESLTGGLADADTYIIVKCPHLDIELLPVCVEVGGEVVNDFLRLTYDVTNEEAVEIERVLLNNPGATIVSCPQQTVDVERVCYTLSDVNYVGWLVTRHDLLNDTMYGLLVDYALAPVVGGTIIDCVQSVNTVPICYLDETIQRGYRQEFYGQDGNVIDTIYYSATWTDLGDIVELVECPSTDWELEPVCYVIGDNGIQHGFIQVHRDTLNNIVFTEDSVLRDLSLTPVVGATLIQCPNVAYTVEQTPVCYSPVGSTSSATSYGLLVHVYEVTEETLGDMTLRSRTLLDRDGNVIDDSLYTLRPCAHTVPTISSVCYTTNGGVTILSGFVEVVYGITQTLSEILSTRLLSSSFVPVVGGTIIPCESTLVTSLQTVQSVSGVELVNGAGSFTVNPAFQVRSVSWSTVMVDPLILSGISISLTMGSGNVVTQAVGPHSSHTWNLEDTDDYINSFTVTSNGASMRVYWNATN